MMSASKCKHVVQYQHNVSIYLEALVTGYSTIKKSLVASPFSPFGFASSFVGTHLEGAGVNLFLRQASGYKGMSDREKEPLYKSTYRICGTASQLSKNLTSFGTIFKAYLDSCCLATLSIIY